MNQKDINLAMNWLQDICKIKSGKIDESMFVITKSLSGYYKNPQGIAHKVLADRMAERNQEINLNQMIAFHICILKWMNHPSPMDFTKMESKSF